jgi:hypothetical protein
MAIAYMDKNADAVGTVSDTYTITGSNDQFSIAIDGGSNQVFTLTHGTRTAAQIVSDLSGLTSATASVVTIGGAATYVRIRTTSSNGATSSILVNAPSNNANATLGFTATTYYGGANVNTTFVGGTKQQIINGIETALLSAGWITLSGSGTSALKMQSSMSPASQNLRIRLNVKDNGNNCTVCSLENVQGSRVASNGTSNGGQLLPATGKVFRVIANKYQAFVLVPGSVTTRDFACWGVPYLPTWLQGVAYECAWLQGSGTSDTDTTTGRKSFRTVLGSMSNQGGESTLNQSFYNLNMWENAQGGTSNFGMPGLFFFAGPTNGFSSTSMNYRWADGSAMMSDPIMSWGTTGATDEGLARGQLWDAFVTGEPYPADTPLSSIDSHNWFCITNLNSGQVAQGTVRGTLFVVVP